ncbi:MAG: hypothetical protein JKY15_08395 [Deltaproteobacteria bacterium]|nr:hypothetical protein [Deltaproteobacteria bacterium]
MYSEMRQVGNSKGIILPKAIIKQCHFEKIVELDVSEGVLMIKAVPAHRALWAKAFESVKKSHDPTEAEWQAFSNEADDSEWVW